MNRTETLSQTETSGYLLGSADTLIFMADAQINRYGTRKQRVHSSKSSKRYIWLISILTLIGVLIAGWFTFSNPASYQETKIITFKPLSNHELQLVFLVNMPPEREAICTAQALSAEKAVVGVKQIDIPKSPTNNRRFDIVIETIEPAVTGVIAHCSSE